MPRSRIFPRTTKAADDGRPTWSVVGSGVYQFQFVELIPGTKRPKFKDWLEKTTACIPSPNYGVLCGIEIWPGYLLLIIDVDVKKGDGLTHWRRLQADFGLPPTACVRTPSGGWHFYYLVPKDVLLDGIFNVISNLGYEHIDLLATGRFAVGPDSAIDGQTYDWHVYPSEFEEGLAILPPAFLAVLRTHAARRPASPIKCSQTPASVPSGASIPLPTIVAMGDHRSGYSDEDLLSIIKGRFPPAESGRDHQMTRCIAYLSRTKRLPPERVRLLMQHYLEDFPQFFREDQQEFQKLIRYKVDYLQQRAGYTPRDYLAETAAQTLAPECEAFLVDLDRSALPLTMVNGKPGDEGQRRPGRLTEKDRRWLRVLLLHYQYQRSMGQCETELSLTDRELVEIYERLYDQKINREVIYDFKAKFFTRCKDGKPRQATVVELLKVKSLGKMGNAKSPSTPSVYYVTGLPRASAPALLPVREDTEVAVDSSWWDDDDAQEEVVPSPGAVPTVSPAEVVAVPQGDAPVSQVFHGTLAPEAVPVAPGDALTGDEARGPSAAPESQRNANEGPAEARQDIAGTQETCGAEEEKQAMIFSTDVASLTSTPPTDQRVPRDTDEPLPRINSSEVAGS